MGARCEEECQGRAIIPALTTQVQHNRPGLLRRLESKDKDPTEDSGARSKW
jgi:hypothetical protein